MQQAIEKADTLIEALAWIRQFRDKTTVIKLGGSMLSDPEAIKNILMDILFMAVSYTHLTLPTKA